jgi:hypothetical protein
MKCRVVESFTFLSFVLIKKSKQMEMFYFIRRSKRNVGERMRRREGGGRDRE